MPDVTLRLKQPAALGRNPRGTAPVDTYRYVPGSVLRGALAQAWIRDHGKPRHAAPALREQFRYLFEGPIRYGPLFDPDSDVVPLSVLRCKYRPRQACRDYVHDEAVQSVRADGATDPRPRCPECGGMTEPGRGEVEFFDNADASPQVTQITRTALHNERAADGALFTRRALTARRNGKQRTLTGRIIAPDPDRASWLFREQLIHIGARRSTDGAALYLPSETSSSVPNPADLLVDDLLIVRLTSPGLLVDAAGRPAVRPDTRLLAELLGFGPDAPVTVVDAWLRREQIGGWHALTNLPKSTELAVTAGTVFRVRLPGTPSGEHLARLVDHGLGLRRTEGYGWIELGPWKPRTTSVPEALPAGRSTAGQLLATDLHRLTDETSWFHDKLRTCLQDRRGGNPPDLGFLNTRRAEVLHGKGGDTPLRQRIVDLVRGDLAELERAVVELEALSSSTEVER